MKQIVHQPKIHYYILLLIVLCPCVHATTSKKATGNTERQKSQIQQPVHKAAIDGNMDFFTNLSEQDSITKILNTKDKSHHNWTPLHYATDNNQEDIVRFILGQSGIHVNAETKDNKSTALHILIHGQHFNLLDCFIAYKQKGKQQQFTRLFLHKKDKQGKRPFDYFPKVEDQQLAKYRAKWYELVGKQPKQPKITSQDERLNAKQEDTQETTPKPPLPAANISMEPLSPTTSNDVVTSSPFSVANANIDRSTVPDQAMSTSAIATIQQPRKQSINSQEAQPITTKTIPKAISTTQESQQHSPVYDPLQQVTKANTTPTQAFKPITTKGV